MRSPTDLDVGDRLVSIMLPHSTRICAGKDGVMSIVLARMDGPLGSYFVASITYDHPDRPDQIIPLHQAASFEVLNP